MQNKTKQQQQL